MDKMLQIRVVFDALDKLTGPLRNIGKGSAKANAELKATRDELKALQVAQRDLTAFRRLKTDMQGADEAMAAARKRAADLQEKLRTVEGPADKMRAALRKANIEVKSLGEAQLAQRRRAVELSKSLRDTGLDVGRLGDAERDLKSRTDSANQSLRRQAEHLKAVAARSQKISAGKERGSRLQSAGGEIAAGGAASLGVGAAIGTPFVKSINDAGDYESAMTDIGQKANLSRAEAKKLGDQLAANGRLVNQAPSSMVEGVDVLTGLGATVPDAMKMITPLGRAATAYKAEMADLGNTAFAVQQSLKVSVDETAKSLDAMASTTKGGGFEFKDMATAMPSLAPAYQALKQKGVPAVSDLAAALQVVRLGTGDSASAATNLQNLLQKIGSPTTTKNFAKLGVNLEQEMKRAAAAGKTPIEAITEATNKALKGDLSKLGYIFEDAQVQEAIRPLIQNIDLYRKIRTEANTASGTVMTDFTERMKDSKQAGKSISNAFKDIGLGLGASVLPEITAIQTQAAKMLRNFAAWTREHPKLAKGIMIVVAVVAALLAFFGLLAIAVGGVVAAIGTFMIVAVFGEIIAAVAAVIAIIVMLGVAIWGVVKSWAPFKAYVVKLWDDTRAMFNQGLEWIKGLGAKFSEAGGNLMSGLINGIKAKFASVKAAVMAIGDSVANWFKARLGIHSPSRIFAQLGVHTMDGLKVGLDRGKEDPLRSVRATAAALAAAMTLPGAAVASPEARLASISAPARPGSWPAPRQPDHLRLVRAIAADLASAMALPGAERPTDAPLPPVPFPPRRSVAIKADEGARTRAVDDRKIDIHVHPTPGMDENKLARLVAQEVARIQRGSAVTRRSAYADGDD